MLMRVSNCEGAETVRTGAVLDVPQNSHSVDIEIGGVERFNIYELNGKLIVSPRGELVIRIIEDLGGLELSVEEHQHE